MFEGVMGVAYYQCRQILGDRYHRLAPVFPPDPTSRKATSGKPGYRPRRR